MGSRTPVNRLEIGEETGKGRIPGCRMPGGLLCVIGKQVGLFTASVFLVKKESRSEAEN